MVYVLDVLREYVIRKRQILECGDQVIFGDLAWPKTVETNYIIWGSGKNGVPKEYYTLETVLFLLSNDTISHPAYVRKAAVEHVPCIRRANRKDLLKYIKGLSVTSAHVDKTAPCEMPTQLVVIPDYEPVEIMDNNPKTDDENEALDFNVPIQTSDSFDNIRRPGLKLLMNYLKSVREVSSDTDNSVQMEIPIEEMPDPDESTESTFKKPMLVDAYLAAKFTSKKSTLTDDIIRKRRRNLQ